jgi:hypothetical protein
VRGKENSRKSRYRMLNDKPLWFRAERCCVGIGDRVTTTSGAAE